MKIPEQDQFREILHRNRGLIQPVVDFDPAADKLLVMDFTEKNTRLGGMLNENTGVLSRYIRQELEAAGCRYGIGGYNEHRTIYARSEMFSALADGDEPRRLHLGTDIWGAAGTPVYVPLPATVHSFAFNNRFGDYGATIILAHPLESFTFYTLYGHLNRASLQYLTESMELAAGAKLAEFGQPRENGYWPPHLHFQIILDMGLYRGDYPGVCRFSERDKWLCNSPDPDCVLLLDQYLA